ncbi:YdcF family protein [Candidatus Nomurabacteria bacterium]|nr:YdcF family protein [Candidatus Nomurabacteria bacterium]
MADDQLFVLAKKLQAVCIFTGDIVPTDEPRYKEVGGFRSSYGLESDATGPVFSYQRVLAAANLWDLNRLLKIVPSGGPTNIAGKENVTISDVVSFELTRMLGVSRDSIVEEPRASNTMEQVMYCGDKVLEQGWSSPRVAILAPCWQFPRISAMLTLTRHHRSPLLPGVTQFVSMERVLAAFDPKWNDIFVEWYSDSKAREMFAKEALGTGQLWTGHQPQYPGPFRGFDDPLTI